MYQSLQAGRAVAAALVVLFHLGGTFAQDKYFGAKWIDGPFAWGDAGVEFFFVLSGFLITITNRHDFGRPQALPRYLVKRVLRIYPTYWLICLAVCAAAVVVVPLRQSLPSDAWIFIKALALIPQNPDVAGATGAPILFVAWSLQYELLFYAVIGLALWSRSAGVAAALALVAVHLGCQFGQGCGFPGSFLANNLIFVFALGVGGAWLVKSRLRLPRPLVSGAVACVAFVAFGLFESWYGRDRLPVDRRMVYGALGAVIIVAFAQAEDTGVLRLRQRWIDLLGDSSYALYLLHIPMISLLVKLLARFAGANPFVILLLFVVVFLACVGSALLFHLFVERRLLAVFNGIAYRMLRIAPRRPASGSPLESGCPQESPVRSDRAASPSAPGGVDGLPATRRG